MFTQYKFNEKQNGMVTASTSLTELKLLVKDCNYSNNNNNNCFQKPEAAEHYSTTAQTSR